MPTSSTNTSNQLKALAMIKAAYPKFTHEQGMVYARLTADIPDVILLKAIELIIKESQFLPTVAEIRNRAIELYKMAKGKTLPDASKAWGDVVKAFGTVGMNTVPTFEDPLTTETVKRMGWKELCLTPIENTATIRSQFLKIYGTLAKQTEKKARTEYALEDGAVKTVVSDMVKKIAGKAKL